MEKRPRIRPHREYPDAPRIILDPDVAVCPFCGQKLRTLRNWHSRKTIQTLKGPLFVAGHTKVCSTPGCRASGQRFYAGKVWRYSLPRSSYGLDVLAYIGWEHDHGHRQLVEIQRDLNAQGVDINERNVGKVYRQFLALLSGAGEDFKARLRATVQQYGGVIWAIDGLEPEGSSRILYVLYEVLSGQAFGALQGAGLGEEELVTWLSAYRDPEVPVLATLSDGEATLMAALKACWSQAPHQRCQVHFLNNLADDVLGYDDELRKAMRQDLGGLPQVPEQKPVDPGGLPQVPEQKPVDLSGLPQVPEQKPVDPDFPPCRPAAGEA